MNIKGIEEAHAKPEEILLRLSCGRMASPTDEIGTPLQTGERGNIHSARLEKNHGVQSISVFQLYCCNRFDTFQKYLPSRNHVPSSALDTGNGTVYKTRTLPLLGELIL